MRKLLYTLLLITPFCVNAQVNLSSGLVAHYPLDGNFNDVSGNGNNGTGISGVGFGPDRFGNANGAASFDGIDDWISVPASPSISPSSKFTLALRFYTTSNAYQMVASKADYPSFSGPDNIQYVLGINGGSRNPTNALYWTTAHSGGCISTSSSAATYRTSYGDIPDANKWYCVVLTFENGVKKVYMNGSLISTATITGTGSNGSIDSCTSGSFRLGVWWPGDPIWFKGLIDDVRIYNRALSQQEADSFCNLRPEGASRIVNRYAAVTGRGPTCTNSFEVDDAAGFAAGDTVLMIQMKGAVIDSSNTPNFGQVTALNGAGNHEYNIVQAVFGNRITLRNQVLKSYDIPTGKVQFVRVPSYTTYTISLPHTAMPWNGSKGGVFAIRVAGMLTLNAPVTADSLGFRSGQPLLLSQFTCNKTDYYYPPTNNDGAEKGEGIAEVSVSRRYGRGRLANGGGGGNDHNSGGAGGGTYGTGGGGGDQYYLGACATDPNIGGVPGTMNPAHLGGRMFMGGGGGCGHGNNTAEKAGGAGGGIVILDAGSISGNGQLVSANGGNAPECSGPGTFPGPCQNDGSGGGGGGGLIYITASTISGGLQTQAKGGKGSNVWLMSGIPSTGPGGGGGGGGLALVTGTAAAVTQTLTGGASGISPQLATNHNAQPGSVGQSFTSAPIPFANVAFAANPVKPSFRDSVTGCLVRRFINTTSPTPVQFSWTVTGLGTSTDAEPEFTFPQPGTYEVVLWITDANGCRDSIRRNIAITVPTGRRDDSSYCGAGDITIKARGGTSYAWTPAAGLSSTNTQSVTLTGIDPTTSVTRTYYVAVTIALDCIVTDTYRVRVTPPPVASFRFQPDPPQANTPVQFINESRNALGSLWNFGDGTGSGESNPEHLFNGTRTYNVCLIAYGPQSCADTFCKDVPAEYRKALGVPTAFSPNGDGSNDVLYVKGGPFTSMSFSIFNRWGQRVFQTNDQTSGWNGVYGGVAQPIDVYAYVISVTFADGSTETRKGNITLLR